MTTVHDVVKSALRLIQVINPAQAVTAADMETGIQVLNRMMTLWESYPLPMGWLNVQSPDDEMPTAPEAEQAVVANLAMTLSAEYGVEPSATVAAMAQNGLEVLRRQFLNANPLDRNVNAPVGRNGWYGGTAMGGWWPYS